MPACSGILPRRKSSFSAKLPLCPAKEHKPDSSAPGMVVLETLHMNVKIHIRVPELTQHVQRVPAGGDSCFPLCGRSSDSQVSYLRLRVSRQNPMPRCLRHEEVCFRGRQTVFTCFSSASAFAKGVLDGAVEDRLSLSGILALLLAEAPCLFLSFACLSSGLHG